MRRLALVACALALLLGASGCARTPAGADRDLTDDWAMLAEAKVPEPQVGDCWSTDSFELADVLAAPGRVNQTGCDVEHSFETAHVGHFTGPLAEAGTPPGRDEMVEAYTECDAAAKDFLGAPWQTGRVHLLIFAPTGAQWTGGARFFRCDVGALRSEAGYLEPRTRTLKGVLAPGGQLTLTCGVQVGASKDSWDDITPTACTTPHDVEFVGFAQAKTPTYPADDKAVDTAFANVCEQQLLAYTGMSASHLDRQANLYYGYWITSGQDEWKAGNHTARCYALIEKKKISRSLRSVGNTAV